MIAIATALSPAPAETQPMSDVAQIARSVRFHQDAEALAALANLPAERRSQPDVAYLRGRLLARQNRLADAAHAYAQAAQSASDLPERVRTDLAFRQGRALLRSGQYAEAISALTSVAAGRGSRAALARALMAEARLEAGDLRAAVPALRAVAQEDARDVDTFAVRLELADALSRLGDRPAAVAELRSLMVDRPRHPNMDLAVARLTQLGGSLEFNRAEHLTRSANLSRGGHHGAAYDELVAAGSGSSRASRAEWQHQAGDELYRARRYAEAFELLRRAARVRSDTQQQDALHAARALARADRDTEAIAAFRRLVRRWPRSSQAAHAEYLGAWLELRHGSARGATHMRAFLRGPRGHQSAGRALAARWQLAMDAYRRRRYRAAAALFGDYANSRRGPMFQGRGLYWRARSLERAHDPSAVDVYTRVLSVAPLHWYGVLAASRLEAMHQTVPPPFGAAVTSMPRTQAATTSPFAGTAVADAAAVRAMTFYAHLGLTQDAVKTLRANERVLRRALGADWRRLLTRAYVALGDYARPYQLAITPWKALSRAPRSEDAWLWEAAWPRPYRQSVDAAARAESLDPALLYAIMRQESGYNAHAVSPVGAVGLLQVMPHAGELIARRLGRPYRAEHLFDPRENVRLGAAEVAHVLARFHGNIPLALAAYNAGAHRVVQWLERSPRTDLDLFVEEIPFDETRNYVRRVSSHFVAYRYIDDPSRGWALELPATVAEAEPHD